VKPLEKIQDIRIMQLDGITGGGGSRDGSPTDEVINSALRYRVQAPLIDSLLSDIGIEGGGLAKQGGLIREASDMQRISNAVQKVVDKEGGGGNSGSDGGNDSDGGPGGSSSSSSGQSRGNS
jgi:hypothetical protein